MNFDEKVFHSIKLKMENSMKSFHRFFFVLLVLVSNYCVHSQYLEVSSNKRYLVTDNKKPFFWMGDTGWELLHKLDTREIKTYLSNRSAKGYTVIQTVLLAECDGLTIPTPEGFLPLDGLNPETPNVNYFNKVDKVVEMAAQYGLYMALLPTWGAHVEDKPHGLFENLHVFTPASAFNYGKFLGARYKNNWNVLWIVGGDRTPDGYEEIWTQMIKGLREGSQNKHLVSYHPSGGNSIANYPKIAAQLDFYMLQSGHGNLVTPNYKMIQHDYEILPVKPVMDSEPMYEDIPIAFNSSNGYTTDYESRRAMYWSVFAGGFGVTYGNNSVWQMNRKEYPSVLDPLQTWDQAIDSKGSFQVAFLKKLMLSRPFTTRIPDKDLVMPYNLEADFKLATRDGNPGKKDATYIMSYHPVFESWTSINTSVIAAKKIRIWLFDPRNGLAYFLSEQPNTGSYKVNANSPIRKTMGGPDWVFVIDAADSNYPAPGKVNQ